jgi:hypothetical protein
MPKRQADASSGLLVALSDGIDRGRQKGEQEVSGFRCRACRADDRTVILVSFFGMNQVSVYALDRQEFPRMLMRAVARFA